MHLLDLRSCLQALFFPLLLSGLGRVASSETDRLKMIRMNQLDFTISQAQALFISLEERQVLWAQQFWGLDTEMRKTQVLRKTLDKTDNTMLFARM